ncbi:hypothetical protein ANN_17918 [Periplaneta americana]|uniref:Reverse transcriptase domain-containing protein n=1 Tax=Periplaneta americana TaxID=6978 RepID=A0ABQ8SMT0_PERAM|nr:hypothetical protein ANN_17918 [Periplaneta americana]
MERGVPSHKLSARSRNTVRYNLPRLKFDDTGVKHKQITLLGFSTVHWIALLITFHASVIWQFELYFVFQKYYNVQCVSKVTVKKLDYIKVVDIRFPEKINTFASAHISQFMRGNRSTIDQIFCIRQIMEKKWKYKGTVHQLFTDFKMEYDWVKREVLYDILIEFGIPKKLVRLIKIYLSETYSRVRIGSTLKKKSPGRNSIALRLSEATTIRLQSHGCGKPRKKPKTKGGSNPSPNAAPDQQPSESAD